MSTSALSYDEKRLLLPDFHIVRSVWYNHVMRRIEEFPPSLPRARPYIPVCTVWPRINIKLCYILVTRIRLHIEINSRTFCRLPQLPLTSGSRYKLTQMRGINFIFAETSLINHSKAYFETIAAFHCLKKLRILVCWLWFDSNAIQMYYLPVRRSTSTLLYGSCFFYLFPSN